MKKIFVTGGAGFVGANLIRKILGRGDEVHVLAQENSSDENVKQILKSIHIHRFSLEDFSGIKNLLEQIKPDGIFHLAASTLMHGHTAAEEEVIRTNVLGTLNLVNAALEVPDLRFFVNTGTFLELSAPEIYSATKLLNTKLVESFAKTRGLPGITLRVFTPYGPYIQPGRLVRSLIEKALKGEPLILTSKSVTRDFIFVGDLADLYLEASEKADSLKGMVFNAGVGRAVTLAELVEKILKLTGSKSSIEWGSFKGADYDKDRWQADMSDTFSSFHWRPKHSLEEGLSKTIDWVKAL